MEKGPPPNPHSKNLSNIFHGKDFITCAFWMNRGSFRRSPQGDRACHSSTAHTLYVSILIRQVVERLQATSPRQRAKPIGVILNVRERGRCCRLVFMPSPASSEESCSDAERLKTKGKVTFIWKAIQTRYLIPHRLRLAVLLRSKRKAFFLAYAKLLSPQAAHQDDTKGIAPLGFAPLLWHSRSP